MNEDENNVTDAVDVMVRVDKEMLKWLRVDKFPDDPKELADAIREVVYLDYTCEGWWGT